MQLVTDPALLARLNAGRNNVVKAAPSPDPKFIPGAPGYVYDPKKNTAVPIANAPPEKSTVPVGYRTVKGGRLEPIPGGPADKTANGDSLSPEALDAETVNWILTGKMSPMGMGNGPLRVQIQNNRPVIMRKYGITENQLPGVQRQFDADAKAYSQRVLQTSFMQQARDAAGQHVEQITGYLKHLPGQTSLTPVNAVTLAAQRATSGETVSNLDATMPLLQAEIAKIMTANPSGSGQLTDEARREFDILNSSRSPEVRIKAMNAVIEMADRKIAGTQAEADRLNQHITGGLSSYGHGAMGAGPPAPPPPPAAKGPGFAPPPGMDGGTTADSGPSGTKSRWVPDPKIGAQVDAFIRNGVPYAAANDWATKNGADPIPQGTYNQWLKYVKTHPASTGMVAAAKQLPLTDFQQVMDPISRSGPGSFAAHYANAATAGIPSMLAGDEGRQALNVMGATHPTLSGIGDFAGAVTGTLGGGAAVRGAGRLLGGRAAAALAAPGRTALLGDLGYGGMFGANENPDHPILGAAEGAGAMLAGNAAGRFLVAPAARAIGSTAIAQKGINAALDTPLGRIMQERFGAPETFDPAAKPATPDNILYKQANKSGIDGINQNLADASRLNLPYSLADADPRLRNLAGSASRLNQDVRANAETAIGDRQMGQADRAVQAIDTHLAPIPNMTDLRGGLLKQAQSASKPLYEQAMQQPAPYDATINEMLGTPAGSRAVRSGYDIGLNRGASPADLSFTTGVNGEPMIHGQPNWRTLQLTKMGLDSAVEKARDPMTGKLNLADPQVGALNDLRQRFVAHLGSINPDYAAANSAYARPMGFADAADRGYSNASGAVPPDRLGASLANLKAGQQPFFQQGYAGALADQANKVRLSGDPYTSIHGSPAQQAKIGQVFPDGAANFARVHALEKDMARTAYETTGGSPTAARQAADDQFGSRLLGHALDIGTSVASGAPTPGMFAGLLGKRLPDAIKFGVGKAAQKSAGEIGPTLLDQDPAKAQAILAQIIQSRKAWDDYVAKSRGAFGALGGVAAAPFGFTSASQQ